MQKIYELAYTVRETMVTDTSRKATWTSKVLFRVVNYLANKY